MAVITLPVPGESPNWGSKLNTAILRINQELESLGVRVTLVESRVSALSLRVSTVEDRLTDLEDNLVDAVRDIAADIIASDPAIIQAAQDAVDEVLAEEDVVLGPDGRALPTPPNGDTYWGVLPRSSGYSWGVVMSDGNAGDYVALGVKLNGDVGGRITGSSESSSPNVRWRVRDCMQEWWIGPAVQRHEGWYSTAGIGDQGQIVAADIDDRTPPLSVQVGTAEVDEHNAPGRFVLPGRGSLMQWTWHGNTTTLFFSVGPGSGRAEGHRDQPVQTIDIGSGTSYGVIHHLPLKATTNTDTFWILLRNGGNWGIAEVVVNWSTGIVTMPGTYKRLVSFSAQPYVTPAPGGTNGAGNPTLRLAAGYNPAANRHEVYLLELDMVTGILHDVANPSVTHNINTAPSYLSDSALTPVLGPTGSGTRRLLGMRPATGGSGWGILTVEYSGAVAPSGVITERVYTPGSGLGSARSFGVTGAHSERYPAGAQYAEDGTVWHSNESGGTWSLSHEWSVVHRSTKALMRPMPTPPGGPVDVLVSEVGRYAIYLDWGDTDLLAITEDVT